ncbi:MAG: YidB family protein [Reyranella sp.]|nr:YidB family protein [Reyranella sp.]
MALLDILAGRRDASSRFPPLAMALLGLLAYKRLRNPSPHGERPGNGFADRVEDFLKPSATAGGGPTVKGVVGALLTGGLMDLVAQFRGAGKADTIDSWVSRGPNQVVSPNDLSRVLTEEQIAFLVERTGMTREELLAGLSDRLPQVVDQLTPDGRLPTAEEMQRSV